MSITGEAISRIAARMAHRAHDAEGFLKNIEDRIADLKKRDPSADSVVQEKIDELEDRCSRLTIAIADYKRAEKIVLTFPEVLEALDSFQLWARVDSEPLRRQKMKLEFEIADGAIKIGKEVLR